METPEPDESEGAEPGADDTLEGLADRTAALADRAIDAMRREAHLPGFGDDQDEGGPPIDGDQSAEPAVEPLGFLSSRLLTLVVVLALFTAVVGVGITVSVGLEDWYMHAAMYTVLLSFLFIYTNSHHRLHRLARGLYAVVSLTLLLVYAWVLHDLVPARTVLSSDGLVMRPDLPALDVPAILLLLVAVGLLVHWVAPDKGNADATG